MTTFLLIRHGETDAIGKSIMGWTRGWHLNHNGKLQVEKLAQTLAHVPIRAVYTSPLERAIETAGPIARSHGLSAQVLDDIGEVRFGEWEGLSMLELDRKEEWRRFNTYRSGTYPPGGESMIETQARMVRCMENLRRQHPDAAVAVVSHGDPIRALIASCLSIPLDFQLRFEIAPASVSVMETNEWGPRVWCLNHTGALPI